MTITQDCRPLARACGGEGEERRGHGGRVLSGTVSYSTLNITDDKQLLIDSHSPALYSKVQILCKVISEDVLQKINKEIKIKK